MITNERQYRITKAQAEKFESALAQTSDAPTPDSGIHPVIWQAQHSAMASQLGDLQEEIEAYEKLQSGQQRAWVLQSFEELPTALIQARIVNGMSQKELAAQLGLKEQQLQRYEASNYSGASWARLCEIMQALGVSLTGDFSVSPPVISPTAFVSKLVDAGIDQELLFNRLLPSRLAGELSYYINSVAATRKSAPTHKRSRPEGYGRSTEEVLQHVSSSLAPIFRWSREDILSPSNALRVDLTVAGAPQFKLKKRANAPRVAAYTVYAHYLALLILRATEDLPSRPLPRNSKEVWQDILASGGEVNLETALEYVWSLGIPVLPLTGSGGFHGACWRVQGRNIIALKQNTSALAAWLHDLLHELWHAMQSPDEPSLAIIEAEPTSDERLSSPQERDANEFAARIGLNGRGDQLVELCIEKAGGKIPSLKRAVQQVAEQYAAPADRLANYLAYKISIDPGLTGENWWGTATTFQIEGHPWCIVRDVLIRRLNWDSLNEFDAALLKRALEVDA